MKTLVIVILSLLATCGTSNASPSKYIPLCNEFGKLGICVLYSPPAIVKCGVPLTYWVSVTNYENVAFLDLFISGDSKFGEKYYSWIVSQTCRKLTKNASCVMSFHPVIPCDQIGDHTNMVTFTGVRMDAVPIYDHVFPINPFKVIK